VPQGSVIRPLLYLIYTSDAPIWDKTLIATFADDTAILSSDADPARALRKTTSSSQSFTNLLKKWKIKVNLVKFTQITFTTRRALCPQENINNVPIPIHTEVKYLGLHLDQN
jgi:hypothetical protein